MEKRRKRIALIGLDGSGKSANIDKMKIDVDYKDYNFLWVRWEPTLLKPLYKLLNKKVKSDKKIETKEQSGNENFLKDSEEQKALNSEYNKKSVLKEKIFKNKAVCSVWMGLALVDYFFQFHIKTFPYIVKGENIIFDRFYLDLFVDQGINFGYSPEKIYNEIKKHKWLFPKIDKIIYIRVSPETCYKRKDDIPNMDYLNRRYDIYENLSKDENYISVDGEKPFEIVSKEIKDIILNDKK